MIYLSSAAPRSRLGATNGLAQTVASLMRAIGPYSATSLFAFSIDRNVLGGNFAYFVLVLIGVMSLGAASMFPRYATVAEVRRKT